MSTPIDAVLNELEHADAEFGAGRAGGYQDMYSHTDDVTIFGAFGGHEHGWDTVGPRLAWAATQFNPTTDTKLERTLISANFGTELGYTVTLEGAPGTTTVAGTTMGGLRVTRVSTRRRPLEDRPPPRRPADQQGPTRRHTDMTGARTGSAGGEVAGALAARDVMSQAFRSRDLNALAHLLAADLVVNAPINQVVDRDNLFDRIRRREVHYADGPSTTNIEFAEARHDLVVIMGEEIVHPIEHTPHTGCTVHRRFTDIWRPHATAWELAIRQATITHIDPA